MAHDIVCSVAILLHILQFSPSEKKCRRILKEMQDPPAFYPSKMKEHFEGHLRFDKSFLTNFSVYIC